MRVIGLAGWSGAGKTTLLRRLIPLLTARDLRVSTLKHAHHNFDVDQPARIRGNTGRPAPREVLVASSAALGVDARIAMATRNPGCQRLLAQMSPVDLVLVEGFKREAHPKIEVHRVANAKPLLHPDDPSIVAIASDAPLHGLRIPLHHLDDVAAIADVVLRRAVAIDAIDWFGRRDS